MSQLDSLIRLCYDSYYLTDGHVLNIWCQKVSSAQFNMFMEIFWWKSIKCINYVHLQYSFLIRPAMATSVHDPDQIGTFEINVDRKECTDENKNRKSPATK